MDYEKRQEEIGFEETESGLKNHENKYESALIRFGASSFSSKDWVGPFYPRGTAAADFLVHYATVFDTVECDATFYGIPARRTVEGWRAKTPEGFLLSSKLPREITHEKGMVDCAEHVTAGRTVPIGREKPSVASRERFGVLGPSIS